VYHVSFLTLRHTDEEMRRGAYQWGRWTVIHKCRRKAEAIRRCEEYPTRAVATKAYDSHSIADNGKPALIDPYVR
jgi:hypothetical protein